MIKRYLVLAAACIATTTIAGADQLVPNGAESVDIGRFHGIVYYAQGAGDYRVTATIADGEAGLPVRFEAMLADKQNLVISVPRELGEESITLIISRTGDKVILLRPQPVDDTLLVSRRPSD